MASFLKLSKIIINTNHIRNINIKPSNYEIKFATPNMDGFTIFGSGHIELDYPTINVCQKENNEDYNVVKKWIMIEEENSK
jgi:hypothetical protein